VTTYVSVQTRKDSRQTATKTLTSEHMARIRKIKRSYRDLARSKAGWSALEQSILGGC
jgi:hypothetical protein